MARTRTTKPATARAVKIRVSSGDEEAEIDLEMVGPAMSAYDLAHLLGQCLIALSADPDRELQ